MSRISRRHFLAATTVALALPTLIPANVLGQQTRPAPSGRIVMGIVGCGGMGNSNLDAFLNLPDVQVVAACDVDKKHLEETVNKINNHYKNKDCKAYTDYRELMARTDIDVISQATPDHWHALVSVAAANSGKDIYGEKPLARTIVEQQAIVKAVEKNKRIWQTGSWQRSQSHFHKAAEIVRNGLIGKIKHVEVGLPDGPFKQEQQSKAWPGEPIPTELDYDMWIGPSKLVPYVSSRVHGNWRWNYNTGGGQLLDWVGHHCDIAHWGMDCDEKSGPLEIEAHGDFPPVDANWNTCTKYRIELLYPGDITMTMAGGHADIRGGTKWVGTDGWVWVDRGGFDCSNPDWKDYKTLPDSMRKVRLIQSSSHHRNFIDSVKSRKPTITPASTAHHSAIPGHLGLISMLVGRKIKWDSNAETILNDEAAAKLLTRDYRKPWLLA
jgi:predicted dehydrogenase